MGSGVTSVAGLALLVGILAYAQRLGDHKNVHVSRLLLMVTGGMGIAWLFLFVPQALAWIGTVIIMVLVGRPLPAWMRDCLAERATAVSRPRPPLECVGKFAGDWSSYIFRKPYVAEIKNNTSAKLTAVTAGLRLESDHGVYLAANRLTWLMKRQETITPVPGVMHNRATHPFTVVSTSLRDSVDLNAGESQQVVLIVERQDNPVRQVFEGDLHTLVGTLSPDKWKGTITLSTGTLCAEHGFYFELTEDNRLVPLRGDSLTVIGPCRQGEKISN